MPLPTVVVTHGRDQRWEIGLAMQREWTEALRFGLQRVDAPYWETIPVRFAFYGALWRDDLEADRADDILPIQDEMARELLTRGGDAAAKEVLEDRSLFSALTALTAFVDRHVGIGGEAVLQLFLKDLAEYFRDKTRRSQANQVVAREVKAAKGDVVLLGHSMGTIVTYLSLFEEAAALKSVRGYLTFGSPLGMDSMQHHVDAIVHGLPFPEQPKRWVNVYNDEDFATMIRELAPIYRSHDVRAVEDTEAVGRPPGLLAVGRGHDPLIYLSSLGLARQLRSLIDDEPPGGGVAARPPRAEPQAAAAPPAGDVFGGERAAPPWLDEPAVGNGGGAGGAGGPIVGGNVRGGVGAPPPWLDEPPLTRSVDAADLDRIMAEPPKAPPRPFQRAKSPAEIVAGVLAPLPALARKPATESLTTRQAPAVRPTVDRTLSADFPPVVAPESERDLLIAIASQAVFGGGETAFKIERPVGDQKVELKIGVYAPDFEVTTATGEAVAVAKVVLDLDKPQERVDTRFRLRAPKTRQAKDASIWVSVSRGTLPIGQLELRTRIDPAYVAPSGEIKLSFSGARDPDIVLIVADRSDQTVGKGPFDLRVSREGEFVDRSLGQLRVTANAWDAARDILEKFKQVNRLPAKKDRIAKATAIGVDLWWKLPQEFRDFYWEELHDGKAESIAVYSQEPYIPWELIVPQRNRGGRTEPMLGIRYSIARWKQGRHFPDPLVVSGMSVIAPDYPVNALPEAAKEAQDLVGTYGANPVLGNRAAVTKLLRSRGTQLIHFAGHGSYDPANVEDSEIRLSDGNLVPDDLFSASIGKSDRPFVFLNACQVGEQGWDLTQIGGWAEAFCAVGFSGFVGPYWKVNDLVARKASRVFYASLRMNQTVGEAMQSVRQRFLDDDEYPGHTSWLAYSLHCQPNVHVRLPGG